MRSFFDVEIEIFWKIVFLFARDISMTMMILHVYSSLLNLLTLDFVYKERIIIFNIYMLECCKFPEKSKHAFEKLSKFTQGKLPKSARLKFSTRSDTQR